MSSKIKRYKINRTKDIVARKGRGSYSIDDILGSTWESIMSLEYNDLLRLTKDAVKYARRNRNELLKYLMDNDLPLPQSLRKFHKSTSQVNVFDIEKVGIDNLRSFLGRDYDMGYATYDFDVSDMDTKNELYHKLRVASEYLDNSAMNVGLYKEHMKGTIERILDKSELKISFEELSKEQYNNIWRAYNRIVSAQNVELIGGSQEVQQQLFEVAYKNNIYDIDSLVRHIIQKGNISYEEKQIAEDDENEWDIFD